MRNGYAATEGAPCTREDLLYHGTSSLIWAAIRREGSLRPGPHGHQHVSLSRDPRVARYFAGLAAGAHEEGQAAAPVILAVSREDLAGAGLTPLPFIDPVWGAGECEWEAEEAVSGSIPAGLLSEIDMTEFKDRLTREEIIALREANDPLPGAF